MEFKRITTREQAISVKQDLFDLLRQYIGGSLFAQLILGEPMNVHADRICDISIKLKSQLPDSSFIEYLHKQVQEIRRFYDIIGY